MVDVVQVPVEISGPDAPTAPAPSPEREAGLPEKFKSVADMAKAYKELEAKLGSRAAPAEAPAAPAAEAPQGSLKIEQPPAPTPRDASGKFVSAEALAKYEQEYLSAGALGDASYKELEALGFSKDIVDNYVAGRAAQAREYQNSVYSLAGGKETYESMTRWALSGLPAEEQAAFNAAVESGDMGSIRMVMRSLQSAYEQANGRAPSLVNGRPGSASGVTPIQSTAEMVRAMADPRYKTDEAYREQVAQRLRVSDILQRK